MVSIRSLQKKFIPYNMVLVLVSVIAILSLLFMPILTINLGQMMTGLLERVPSEDDELNDSTASIVLLLKALDTKIEFTTVSFANIAFDENPSAAMLTEYVLGDGNIMESAVLSMIATTMLKDSMPSVGELQNLDLAAASSELYALEEEGADPVEVAHNYVDKLNAELDKVGAAHVPDISGAEDAITNMYDTVCDQMGGRFTVEGFICIGLCAGQENPPTTYYDLATRIANGETQNGGGSAYEEINADFVTALVIFEPIAMIGGYMKYVFYAMLVLIAPWLILLFFSLLHILLPNKQVSVWYVMAFGAFPTLLFWALPFVLGKLIGARIGMLAAVFGAMGSFAWISGICFLAVGTLDLLWAGSIKKDIKLFKKLERESQARKG